MAQKKNLTAAAVQMNLQAVYHTADGQEHTLMLRDSIPFAELGALVNDVARAVTDSERGYQPFLYEYAYWGNLLGHYTNFDLSAGVEPTLEILRHSDLIPVLKRHIVAEQLADIERYTAELIAYRKSRTAFDALCATLNDLVKEYGKKFAKALKPRQLEKILSNLSGMSPEDFRQMGKKIKESPAGQEDGATAK